MEIDILEIDILGADISGDDILEVDILRQAQKTNSYLLTGMQMQGKLLFSESLHFTLCFKLRGVCFKLRGGAYGW